MNPTGNGSRLGFRAGRLPDPGFEVAEIGRDPSTGGYFFGSYDGRIRPISDRFVPTGPAWLACPSGEAINGIAVHGRMIAVSTRSEVYVHNLDAIQPPSKIFPVYDGGAHGVIAPRSGTFVAPLGPDGLLSIKSPEQPSTSTWIFGVDGGKAYFLEASYLASDGASDVIVVAARRDGLGILTLSADRQTAGIDQGRFSTVADFDAVSVCSLNSPGFPYAAACLGADSSIRLWRDAREDEGDEFRIGEPKVYSILHAKGHLFVHTSKGRHVMPNLVAGYLGGDNRFENYETRFIPWEASDLILIDEIGFAMLDDGVEAFFVAEVAATPDRLAKAIGSDIAELGAMRRLEASPAGITANTTNINIASNLIIPLTVTQS